MAEHPENLGYIAADLARKGVNFVAIGAWAAQAQGYDLGYRTKDIDVTPDLGRENLERLAEALTEMGALQKFGPFTAEVHFTAEKLAEYPVWNLTCDNGNFDVVFDPTGLEGYRELLKSAHQVEIETDDFRCRVLCADVKDIIRSKRAANRDKDRSVVDRLEAQLAINVNLEKDRGDRRGFDVGL